jgi:hypothetical protein
MKKLLQKLSLYPDKTDLSAWLWSFLIINFAFLYHTLNFMWGNHDVKFIKERVFLSSGLFEGRFTQFIPQTLLTDGQILPVINNLLGFGFLTIGLWLLAKYWDLPKNKFCYTLFITFFATLPYTLAWLYYAFITISCLFWVPVAILGLYLSAQVPLSSRPKTLSLVAILCFYLTLGGYPPIINTFAVCLLGKLTLDYTFKNHSFSALWHTFKPTALNLVIAAILFRITLSFVPHDDVYNLELSKLKDLPLKALQVIKIAFSQLFVTTPFMEKSYKIALFIPCLLAFLSLFFPPSAPKQKSLSFLFFFLPLLATGLTTLLVVPHTEFVSRIDFYGFAFFYAFTVAVLFRSAVPLVRSLAVIFVIPLIFWNTLQDTLALKIWKQGFDAEFQILDQVTERIENDPSFNPKQKYRFFQIGDIPLRPKYYPFSYQKEDTFLLSITYLAMWQSTRLAEFYSPFEYIDHEHPIGAMDITPELYNYLMHDVRYWPDPNSIYVGKDLIIVVLNQYSLNEFRQNLRQMRR